MHQIIEGSITTSGTQDYEGAITLTDNTTLVSGDQITFDTTVNSEGSETNNLTVTATELQVDGIIGGTQTLGAISITGILDLNAAITNATSLSVSSTSNLGADVTTTGDQTYSGAAVLSSNVILTTTANGSVYFGLTLDGGYDLNISTHGTGDVTFVGAVGGITPLGDITISTNEFNAASITAGNLDITHTGAGAITGIITDAAEDNTLALVKAGSATLTLSANNTFTGRHDD